MKNPGENNCVHCGSDCGKNPVIRDEKLISFSEGGISKVKFFVPVIHFTSCIWLLENLSEKKDHKPSYKKLLYKIGVAGFVFINMMT